MVLGGLPGVFRVSSGAVWFFPVVVLRKVFWSWFLGVSDFSLCFFRDLLFCEFCTLCQCLALCGVYVFCDEISTCKVCVCLILWTACDFHCCFPSLPRPVSVFLLRVCAVPFVSVSATGYVTTQKSKPRKKHNEKSDTPRNQDQNTLRRTTTGKNHTAPEDTRNTPGRSPRTIQTAAQILTEF